MMENGFLKYMHYYYYYDWAIGRLYVLNRIEIKRILF